jgi:deoxyadenosine/deoxycytidine kinase
VAIEGSIGAGKTTFLNYLKDLKPLGSFEFFEEPVHEWTNFNGVNLLKNFYEDPERNAFSLQSHINLTKVSQFMSDSGYAVRIFERSLESSQKCFTPILLDLGYLTSTEAEILAANANAAKEWYPSHLRIDRVIYLRTDPEKCFERIKTRNRPEESQISIEYLKSLHEAHEKWIQNLQENGRGDTEVSILDVTPEFESLEPQIKAIHKELAQVSRSNYIYLFFLNKSSAISVNFIKYI